MTHKSDLGAALRALRRRADMSQRELSARSGIPASTVARVESGAAHDPKFRTIERLVAAAGGKLTIGVAADPPEPSAPPNPAEGLVNEGGRRYPAHLDVREVREGKDWWGAWWAHWYQLPRARWPRAAPDYTYDLSRDRRDRRRRRLDDEASVAQLRIERLGHDDGAPANVRRWIAVDRIAVDRTTVDRTTVVGYLAGFVRRRRVDGQEEFVVCDVEVATAWRGRGLGRRLVEALRAELAAAGVRRARVLIDEPGLPIRFFHACGFHPRGPQAAWLTLLPSC